MNQYLYFFALYFFVYGFLGWCTEVAFAAWKEHRFVNRGFLNGPICPIYGVGVGAVVLLLTPFHRNLILLYLTSVILVTALEWATGFVLEKVFHNKWWDYSHMPLNIGGYVCLPFSLVWGVACVLIVDFIHPLIHGVLALIPFGIALFFLVALSAALTADLCFTVSGILKMNRDMAHLQQIANELHAISDKIGQNIYKNTIQAIEREENLSESLETASDEWKNRIAELYRRYQTAVKEPSRIQKRLMKAFPKMQSRRYPEILKELRLRHHR